jgi:hypothetical protein
VTEVLGPAPSRVGVEVLMGEGEPPGRDFAQEAG